MKLDGAPDPAHRYQIMALPTLIVFSDGRPTQRITEVTTKAELRNSLQQGPLAM